MSEVNKSYSLIGLKNLVIAEVLTDTETETTYDAVMPVTGAIEATVSPQNTDPDVQYADDVEYDFVQPDPEITFTTKMADIPLNIQSKIFANKLDKNGVLVRSSDDKPGYFAVGFQSEKADHSYRYVWLYKVRAKPMEESYATKEGTSLNRQTGSVEWTAVKRTSDKLYQAIADEGINGFTKEMGATFLATVYAPEYVGG